MNEKPKENVLPCPFCGNTDCVMDNGVYSHYITCLKCETHGPMGGTIQDARDEWNKRTEQPAPFEEKKAPIDFLKVVEGIKKDQATAQKEAFKQLRIFYLELLESGFTMEDAMAYLAALTRNLSNEKKGDNNGQFKEE